MTEQLSNDLLLRVAADKAVERPPIWLMRQAGRFLKEYREVRAQAGSFRTMIAQPELAAEVTLQPVDLVGVDAAIIFSDILVIPEALGLPYEMIPGKGPHFPQTVRTLSDLKALHPVAEQSNLDHTYQAIRLVKQELNGRVPLIGFAGAPFTIFCYMTEGGGSKTFSVAKSLLYRDPAFAHQLLERITEASIIYLKGQIKAGANLVQLFDSWAGILNQDMYETFALPYLKRICDAITEVPKTVFAKGAFFSLRALGQLNCQVIGLDWQMDPQEAQALLPDKALQGNMDPCQLYASPEAVREATLEMLEAFPPGRHIANLGHGIYPDLPRESVIAMVETVKSFRYGK
jgi:uroporphyrinogen decarboxylase